MIPENEKTVEEKAVEAIDAAIAPEAPPQPTVEPPNPAPEATEPPAPTDTPPTDAPPPVPAEEEQRRQEVQSEMDSLGLKSSKSRERFEAMSSEIATYRPIKEMLEAAGIESAEHISALVERAQAADYFEKTLEDTKAPPEEYAQAISLLGKFNSGDRKLVEEAFDETLDILRRWAPVLGKESFSLDVLENYPDLKEQVEFGEITRKAAMEIVNARLLQQSSQAREQKASEQSRAQQEVESAKQGLNNWHSQMLASEHSATYKACYPQVEAYVKSIAGLVKPEQILPLTQKFFFNLPRQAPPAPSPIRPAGVTAPPVLPETNDPLEALNRALGM